MAAAQQQQQLHVQGHHGHPADATPKVVVGCAQALRSTDSTPYDANKQTTLLLQLLQNHGRQPIAAR
jgi:hypothetical protein